MHKDFNSRKLAVRRTAPVLRLKQMTRKNRFLLLLMLIVISSSLFFIYKKSQSFSGKNLNTHFSKLHAWVATRKEHLQKNMGKAKKVVANKNTVEPQIHFEFYTTLPAMQITVNEPVVENALPVTKAIKQNAKKNSISAEQLEQELVAHIKHKEQKKLAKTKSSEKKKLTVSKQ